MILGSRIRRALAGALALALMLVTASSASAAAKSGVVAQSTAVDPQAVIDYWTPKRMRNAKPIDFPVEPDARSFSEIGLSGGSPASGPPVVVPPAPPSSGDSYSVFPDQETNVANDATFPQRIHGKIFATLPQGNFACSGTVINSPLADLVATAGHCVFGQGVFATNFVFVPGYRNGAQAPGLGGAWPASALFTTTQWASSNAFDGDVGMARIAPVSGFLIQNALGARGVAFNLNPAQNFDIFGYPARPRPNPDEFGDYNGERLIQCDDAPQGGGDDGNFTRGFEAAPNEESIGSAYCFMQQGSSGGGWVIPSMGAVNSVVSHGYCQNRAPSEGPGDPANPPTSADIFPNGVFCGLMFGPYFGTEELNLYNQAATNPAPPPPPAVVPTVTENPKCAELRAKLKKTKKKKKKKKIRKKLRNLGC